MKRTSEPSPEMDESLHNTKTKENMPNLGELNSFVKENIEIPSEMLARLLLKDEKVMATFDTFYLGSYDPNSVESPLSVFSLVFSLVVALLWRYLLRCFKAIIITITTAWASVVIRAVWSSVEGRC